MRRRPSFLLGAVLAASASALLPNLAGGVATASPVDAAGTASPVQAASVAPVPRFAEELNLDAVGLTTDGRLVRFSTLFPGFASTIGAVSGLSPDTGLVGIDYRVQNGRLYGVGNRGGIYVLSTANAAAVKVSQLTVPLAGTLFGVDFNPAANRLRIVSDAGQNLRHNIDDPVGLPPTGVTAVDSPLAYPSAAVSTGITGAAYTNNDLDPTTSTTLFDIDTNLDRVAVQSPANNGTLAATGDLGTVVGPSAGFDIYSTLSDGRAVESSGYAALATGGTYALYSVELLSGQVAPLGRFPAQSQIVDLAFQLNQ